MLALQGCADQRVYRLTRLLLGPWLNALFLLLLIPPTAELVVQGEDGGVELFAAYHRWVAVEVFGDRCRRNRCWRAYHADVLPGPTDMPVGLQDLRDHIVDLGRLLGRQPEALMLPALLLVLRPGPVPTPAICRYCFSAVAWACSSIRLAMSRAVRRARK